MRSIRQYTEEYLKDSFEDIQVAFRRRKVLEILGRHKPDRILEIGCGRLPLFTDYGGYKKYVVVEPSEIFFKNALELKGNLDNVWVLNDFIENVATKLKSQKFDFVIVSALLHEVEDPAIMLESIAGLCHKHTVVHANVPNAGSLHRLLALEAGLISSLTDLSDNNHRLQQHTVFDIETFTGIFSEHGFEIIDSGTYFIKPFAHRQMAEMLNSGIIDQKVLDGFYNLSKYLPSMGSEQFVNCRLSK